MALESVPETNQYKIVVEFLSQISGAFDWGLNSRLTGTHRLRLLRHSAPVIYIHVYETSTLCS